MKLARQENSQGGYALMVVLLLASISIAIYASLAKWASASATVNDRHNTYHAAVSAAEGATESVLSYMARDFFNQSYDPTKASSYGTYLPTSGWAGPFQFGDGAGAVGHAFVNSTGMTVTTNLDPQFSGLYGMAYGCTVRASARPQAPPYPLEGAVQQQVQLACIPLFQFAIFYSMDLEINPGPVMKVTGKVHSNAGLYTAPGTGLEYVDTVSAVGQIVNDRLPDDPNYGSAKVAPVYDAGTNEHVSSLNMPVATNNTPTEVRTILEVPPAGESPQSDAGRQRYYNKTDLIVTTTTTAVTVSAGNWDGFVNLTPDTAGTNASTGFSFVRTNASFWDARENKWTVTTDIDVGALYHWTTNSGASLNGLASLTLGHQLNSIYIDDQRASAGKLTVVRVANGQQLPPDGLTVATSLPVYVQGQFNSPDTTPGSTNTANAKPASLLGDAITILSGNWSDIDSGTKFSSRTAAANTTVNAALLAGIVPTTNYFGTKHYSGGVENFPRFLENWSNQTFTYNGSMVVMFPSRYAASFWVSPGTYYNAPNRKWAFDLNFRDYRRLPPATPQVRKLIRGQWSVVAAD